MGELHPVARRQQELWHRFRVEGDLKARDELVESYGYLVRITAGRIASSVPPSLDREDLISAGAIGLIRAVDAFDFTRQVKFETFAIALIRGAVLEVLRGEDWAPRSVRDKIKGLERAYLEVELRLGRPGTEAEVAEHLQMPIDQFNKLLSEVAQASVLSLDEMLFSSEPDSTLRVVDTVEDTSHSGRTDRGVETRERSGALGVALGRLPPRERQVLAHYYYDGMTFKEIGKILKVSESRVFQLHQQSMMRLRGYLSVDRELFSG